MTCGKLQSVRLLTQSEVERGGDEGKGRGTWEVRPPLSIMTANEWMGGWGSPSGIISLDHYEKEGTMAISLFVRVEI